MSADDGIQRVFDRRAVRQRRDRAAAGLSAHDFLFREVAARLCDRLEDIRRAFPSALDLGGHGGVLAGALSGRGGVETLVETDLSPAMAARAAGGTGGPRLAADEEALPFRDGAFDLVLSNLSLHWVNDLPGALVQARRALKPDGLFLAAMLGAGTLNELRGAWMAAEEAVEGGIGQRVSPFADLSDTAALLQRAGFALPVADADTITVTWPDALALMRDLRGMGETNAAIGRRRGFTRRATLFAAAREYAERFADADGRIPATFRVLYLSGWAPSDSQPQPLRRGSAEARLADALGTEEKPAGDKTPG
jgi:NADH dehydrogenase [ubiquinone] 1 alpha subcomplex assembly factor 5